MTCEHIIRWVAARGAPWSTAMCARDAGHAGKHRTAVAVEANRRHRRTFSKTKSGQAARRRHDRRRYHADPTYRAKNLARSAAWIDSHPLQVMLYQVNAHAASAASALEELS